MALELQQEALTRIVRPKDLATAGLIDTHSNRLFLSLAARGVVESDFSGLQIQSFSVKDKPAYSIRSAPHAIVLNQINQVIRASTGVKTSDRDTIVQRLITILTEGVPHRLYKFDIKEFYDSVDTRLLADQILVDNNIPRATLLILAKYLSEIRQRAINGLPRGIPLSATLAEYALRRFDEFISKLPEVYFYARYVDDIVIVTSRREDPRSFSRKVRKALPFDLDFNTTKTRILDIPVQARSDGQAIVGDLDYLGYNISVHESARVRGRLVRNVDVSIARKKIRRLKTRISLCLIDYLKFPNLWMLVRRLQLLTGNYNVRDYTTGQLRNVGLYCNYRHANATAGLQELDSFLRSALVGNRTRLAARLAAVMTQRERQSLLRFSFVNSFANRTFYNFGTHELTTLKGCWLDA